MLEAREERLFPLLRETSAQALVLCGRALVADGSGALYWPAERTLLVADLHLEKGSSYAARGALLPPYDTPHTLLRLGQAIERYRPARIVALGDSLQDGGAAGRMSTDGLAHLRRLQKGREWIWIAGNHDPDIPAALGGRACSELVLGGLVLRHQPAAGGTTHEIAGHMHPAARLSMYGHSVRRPCFVGNGRRLVLPAFGAFTGELNVLDDAFRPLFGDGGTAVWMLGRQGLYRVAPRFLRGD